MTPICVGALLWAVRGLRMWCLWLLAIVPVVSTYLVSPESRVYSFHGLLHQSLVYQILERGAPPMNPLLAGEVARYTWGPHYVVAWLTGWWGVPPSWGFAMLNVVALVLTVLFLYRTGVCLCGDRRAAAFGVVISMFAFSVSQLGGRLWKPLKIIELYAIPPAEKFTNLNAMPLGIVCFALFLYALARIVVEPSGRRATSAHLLMLVAVAVAGFLYPLLWLGILAGGAGALVTLMIRPGAVRRRRLWTAAAAAMVGSLVSVPYLLMLTRAGGAGGTLRLAGPAHYLTYAMIFLALILPVGALMLYGQREIRSAVTQRPELYRALTGLTIVSVLVSLAIRGPVVPGIEYKYRMLSFIVLGLVAGIAVETLRKRNAVAAWAVISVLALPFVDDLRFKTIDRFDGGVLEAFVEEGIWLRHADPFEDELQRWIATKTSPTAALVDVKLTVPIFGRRALFVGMHRRREVDLGVEGPRENRLDGWGIDPETKMADVLGASPPEVTRRLAIAQAVLGGERLDWVAGELDGVMQHARIDELYVVLRNPDNVPRLAAHRRFASVFRNDRATIFRFIG